MFGICVNLQAAFFHVVVDSKTTGFCFSLILIVNFEKL